MSTDLVFGERGAEGPATGLLVLHHGRGSDELDLLPLADLLDPGRRLHVVTPRAPLSLPGMPGYHWYHVPRVGYPDPLSFDTARIALGAFHDELWERTGIPPEQTVLGGFSMGSVMSYATGLGADRPVPAGVLAFSGFVPSVETWRPSLSDRGQLRVFIAHGQLDPVIGVDFGRSARDLLSEGGLDVEYHEADIGHQIIEPHLRAAAAWLDATFGPGL